MKFFTLDNFFLFLFSIFCCNLIKFYMRFVYASEKVVCTTNTNYDLHLPKPVILHTHLFNKNELILIRNSIHKNILPFQHMPLHKKNLKEKKNTWNISNSRTIHKALKMQLLNGHFSRQSLIIWTIFDINNLLVYLDIFRQFSVRR